ncbi:hypothetical protein CBM2629_A20117 [Cupriavidus taiwanensis]|nr:hypothetical protein CBM2629_A20117 [Cupriavidus taiwanensis]
MAPQPAHRGAGPDHGGPPAGIVIDPVPVSGHAAGAGRPPRVVRRRHHAPDVAAVAGDPPGGVAHPGDRRGLAPALGLVRHHAGGRLSVAGAGGRPGAGQHLPGRPERRPGAPAAHQPAAGAHARSRRRPRGLAPGAGDDGGAERADRGHRRRAPEAIAAHRARAAGAAGRHRGARRRVRQLPAVRAGLHAGADRAGRARRRGPGRRAGRLPLRHRPRHGPRGAPRGAPCGRPRGRAGGITLSCRRHIMPPLALWRDAAALIARKMQKAPETPTEALHLPRSDLKEGEDNNSHLVESARNFKGLPCSTPNCSNRWKPSAGTWTRTSPGTPSTPAC